MYYLHDSRISKDIYIYIHVPNCMYVHNMHICIFTYIYIYIVSCFLNAWIFGRNLIL